MTSTRSRSTKRAKAKSNVSSTDAGAEANIYAAIATRDAINENGQQQGDNHNGKESLASAYPQESKRKRIATVSDYPMIQPESKRKRTATASIFPMIQQQPTKRVANKKTPLQAHRDIDDGVQCPAPPAPPPKKNQKKVLEAEEEFEDSWICCECKEAECMMHPEADQLMICEGPCRRLFHYPCAGLAQLPGPDEAYVCSDCQNNRHCCSICQQYGVDDEDVFLCSREGCGLFFHESCLAMQNVEVRIIPNESHTTTHSTSGVDNTSFNSPEKSSTYYATTGKRQFVCPAHACWTCFQTDPKAKEKQDQCTVLPPTTAKKKKKKGRKGKTASSAFDYKSGRLIRCMECSMSYHITCIPPMARFHELAMLCHLHADTCKLPDLDNETSLQGAIEKNIDERFSVEAMENGRNKNTKLYRSKKETNPFFTGMMGNERTKEELLLQKSAAAERYNLDIKNEEEIRRATKRKQEKLWYCLPCDLRDEVHSKPPSYRHIHANKYDRKNRPPRIPPTGDVCQCIGLCDENCINRMLYTECFGNPPDQSNDSYTNNKKTNCRVGTSCGNRQLLHRKIAKCEPKREKGKGWGLITKENVSKGNLVQEYVGEVIDAKSKDRRLQEWVDEHPNDPNFYIMHLQTGWFLDARYESNLARFINHSCQPNCILLPINVGGHTRNGIFALRDIKAGEYLSYDYHFDTRQADRFICRCGAPNCRGTMKGSNSSVTFRGNDMIRKNGKKQRLNGDSSTGLRWEDAKAKYERDNRFIADYYEQEEKRQSQIAVTVPGASSQNEIVANGPKESFRAVARSTNLFLWRNAVAGAKFSDRLDRLQQRKSKY